MINQALLNRVHKQAWFHKYPRGWPLLLFLIANIVTVISVVAIEHADKKTRGAELDRNLTEISSALQRRITENVALLRAASALFAMQDTVTERHFSEFAKDLQDGSNLYGSVGIGWAPVVRANRLSDFEFSVQQRTDPSYMVHPRPAVGQEWVTPVLFFEPHRPETEKGMGYDMFSEPNRRKAMERAVAGRQPMATQTVHLVVENESIKNVDFVMFMPVFNYQDGKDTVKGFVFSPFRAQEFLNSASDLLRNNQIDIAIYEGDAANGHLIAEKREAAAVGPYIERKMDVVGQAWVLQVSEKQTNALSGISRVILFFGIMSSLVVMAVGRVISKRAAEDRMVLEWFTSQASIRDSLTRELNHRVKNTLANVLSIAALTRRRSNDIDDFTESLSARIRALSATHDLLSKSDWGYAAVGDIISSELAPYMEGVESHVVLTGPEIKLAPNDAMSLGLAIHELATNAAKYGALSNDKGRIHVTWEQLSSDLAQVHWREEGGPVVQEPTKRGFGRDLIEKIVAHELKSQVELDFKPGGVECRFKVPVRVSRAFSLRPSSQEG